MPLPNFIDPSRLGLQPIETRYNGYRFRSRLEARWAVFMDVIGVPYEYEPEAYHLPSGNYLPDFYLPSIQTFAEVKPDPVPGVERVLNLLTELCVATGKNVTLFKGPPQIRDDFPPPEDCPMLWLRCRDEVNKRLQIGTQHVEDGPYLWCECPTCGLCQLQFDGRADRIDCTCKKSEHGDKGYNDKSPKLVYACEIARGYRFEPGAFNPHINPPRPAQG
jgi:hypothetical protein